MNVTLAAGLSACLFCAVLLWLVPSIAQAQSSKPKTVECYCTDRSGSRVELGQQVCLMVDGRMFMAQCQMSLNVPMWRELGEGCLTSAVTSTLPQMSVPQMSVMDQALVRR